MTLRQTAFVLSAFLLLGATIGTGQSPTPTEPGVELRVMSFNIRNGRAKDGENAWEQRTSFVCDVIKDANLDILGVQEAFRFQLDEIRKQLPEFGEVGEGRDGGERGEYSAILYRSSRFAVRDSGTFWLSDTPEVKSRHWGNRYLRVCSWAHLKEIDTGRSFYVFNTHFDHQSQNARLKSAHLIAKRIDNRTHADPFVLTGDFNGDEENPAILHLKGKEGSAPPGPLAVVDTFRQLHPDEETVGTGGGFEGRRNGKKIDYVFVEPTTQVLKADIVRTQRDGRYPSDHFPVSATVRLRTGSQP